MKYNRFHIRAIAAIFAAATLCVSLASCDDIVDFNDDMAMLQAVVAKTTDIPLPTRWLMPERPR